MKKITLIFVLMLLAAPFRLSAAAVAGDANGDGTVNITDVTVLIDYLLYGDVSLIANGNADANNDGVINISDVTSTVDLLLFGPEEEVPEYIDLGLPSGTLWATRNIGAQNPEDYGYYFAWGETAPKNVYDAITYKWWEPYPVYYIKYCNSYYTGTPDYKTELDLEDDAAYVRRGHSWIMPYGWQQEELVNECDWRWTSRNGVNGYLVTGPNGNHIFLPAAGYRDGENLSYAGSCAAYMSREIVGSCEYGDLGDDLVIGIGFDEENYRYDPVWGCGDRWGGKSVRPVRVHN